MSMHVACVSVHNQVSGGAARHWVTIDICRAVTHSKTLGHARATLLADKLCKFSVHYYLRSVLQSYTD